VSEIRITPRIEKLLRDWNITGEETRQTETSVLIFGKRDGQRVVLKVLRAPGDEWHAGRVLKAFDSRGVVQVYEHVEGAVLLEKIVPGTSLANMTLAGEDAAATDILAEVITRMGSPRPPDWCTRVEDWAAGFDRDLHHHNILRDANRGWPAVDPKGVVGETEYEIGAALRNPIEQPDLFASLDTIQRRIGQYESALHLDPERLLQWAFAQAVLSVIWSWEDGVVINESNPVLRLAREIRSMLDSGTRRSRGL
jgi:streptomycin 6-kinase